MSPDRRRIAILVTYFGEWPEWTDLYVETLRRNRAIDFFLMADHPPVVEDAPNVRILPAKLADYADTVRRVLGVAFRPADAYKVCDLRPLLGFLHEDLFAPYDFYGWADVDLLFGDLRAFYTEEILGAFDVISSHAIRVSGHCALFRNTRRNRAMFRRIYRWREALEDPHFVGIDEHGLTNAYTLTVFDRFNQKFGTHLANPLTRSLSARRRRRLYLVEQYTTPFTAIPWIDGSIHSAHPDEWSYHDGRITNTRDGDRCFPYLHFMNFRSSRYRHDRTRAPWEGRSRVCFATPEDMRHGVRIDRRGIYPEGHPPPD